MRLVILILVALICKPVYSGTKIPAQINFSIGSVSVAFSENPSNLKSTDGTTSSTSTPYSGSTTAIPLEFGYEHFTNLKRSYQFKAAGPLMGSNPGRYFNAVAAANFYFSQIGSEATVSDYNFELKIKPKLRYYAGPVLGVGYLVYDTQSATKTDVLFEIGGQGGILYSIGPVWGLKAEVGFSRAVGVLVSASVIKILLGTTYTLGKWSN